MSASERLPIPPMHDLADGEIRACVAGTLDVMVCRVGGQLYALEDLCSHADTTLSDGVLNGYMVVCPLHGAQFDVRDGSHQGPPAWTGVRSFTVVADGDGDAIETVEHDTGGDGGFGAPGGYFRTR